MPEMPFIPTSLAILALLTVIVYRISRTRQNLPPGPPGIPFFGNALQMPKESPWLKFTEWGTIYGDITFAKVFSRKLVIINSYELGQQLLDKRLCYANRPRRYMAELSGFARAMLFKDYGTEVKQGRRLIHNIDLKEFYGVQIKGAHGFAKLLLDDPSNFLEHIRRMVTASLLEFTYGHIVESGDDVLVRLSEEVMAITGKLVSPNRYLVDIFPFLNSLPEGLPGTSFKADARYNRVVIDRLMEEPFAKVMEQIKRGTAKPCFTARHLEGKTDTMSANDIEVLKWAAGMVNTAGADTTSSILSSFFLAMVYNQEAQIKAQKELDSVLGPNALPTFADRSRLPYIECIIKESLRWHPPTPLIGRSLTTDDVINGYTVPAGSFVVANVWGFTHDSNLYPEPSKFNPDRFSPKNGPGSSDILPPDPQMYAFGLGRRRCPGNELANNTLFIMIATVLTLFKIQPEVDEDGQPKLPEERYNQTLTCHPVSFKCQVVPRSEGAISAITYAGDA